MHMHACAPTLPLSLSPSRSLAPLPRSSVRPSVRPIVCPPPPPSFLSCIRASVRPSLSRAYPRAHVCACALACISTAHIHTRAHMCTLTCGTYEHEHACALARTRALLPRRALCTPVALCSYACMVHAVATKAFLHLCVLIAGGSDPMASLYACLGLCIPNLVCRWCVVGRPVRSASPWAPCAI